MKNKELRKQSDKELEKLLDEKQKAVRQFRFNISGSKVKNMKEGGQLRREVARIMTELAQRN